MITDVKICCRFLWKRVRRMFVMFIIYEYIMNTSVASGAMGKGSLQRRFLWKQMDDTVDDLMIGVMSGARVMRGMLGSSKLQQKGRHIDYMPSEATRVKYIIRSPMKTIKFRSPKKTIQIMAVPKPYIEGKFFKPKIKFPSTEDLRKLEKEQELMAEGRMPKKSSQELVAEMESEKHVKDQNEGSILVKSAQKLAMEIESEKNVMEQDEVYKLHKLPGTDISKSHTQLDEEWLPIQQQYPISSKSPTLFSTAKSYAVGKLHTSIIDSLQPESVNTYTRKPFAIGKLHTSIIDSLQQNPPKEERYENPGLVEDTGKLKSYEVTEYTAEESVAGPEYNQSTESSTVESSQSAVNTKVTIALSTSKSATSTTTTEEPNYPQEFLRKYREHITSAASTQTPLRFRSNGAPFESSSFPTIKTNASLLKTKSNIGIQNWPPEGLAPESFGTHAAASTAAQSVTLNKVKPTSKTVTKRRKTQRFTTTIKGSNENDESIPPSHNETHRRGNVRFRGDLLADDI